MTSKYEDLVYVYPAVDEHLKRRAREHAEHFLARVSLDAAVTNGEREFERNIMSLYGYPNFDAQMIQRLKLSIFERCIDELIAQELLALDTRAPDTGETAMTTEHHSHHAHHHADAEKSAEDTSGPATSQADTPQTGGSATTDTSTNASADQVGSQDPPAASPAVEVQANDRKAVPVGENAEKAPSDDDLPF